VEDQCADARAVLALPAAQAAACRLPDLRHVQRPTRHQRLTHSARVTADRVRVAVDLLGGDHAPDVVVDGALRAADDPSIAPVLVGPPELANQLLDARGAAGRLDVVAASQVVAMDEHPARAVRAKRDSTVRVAARLVHDGSADAMFSAGSTGAAMAAALFTLGRLTGVTRPPLAVVMAASEHPVVLLDVGATVEAGADLLAQFALIGTAYARVHLGLSEPRVGLLSVGTEQTKGDDVRKDAFDAIDAVLDGLPARFVGNVEGSDVALGGPADVVVTDGLTGNVLIKGMEGMLACIAAGIGDNDVVLRAFAQATAPFDPDTAGGAILLGVNGVAVIGHGASSACAVASCISAAARAVTDGVVPQVATALADLVARRRAEVGRPLDAAKASG
jgi:glycerol-3-phosphate acyltransferase PlsX